ncbi:MAG: M20/M25/M40 family metallo-hydrolase [Candidatus Sulfotelmatobacter sp.]
MKIPGAFCLCTLVVLTSLAFGQKKSAAVAPAPADATQLQLARESIDLSMYGSIREEGLAHSRVMDYATALFDDIGPRLTGSPNLAKAYKWTSDQFTAMGCSNVHLENWGDFGMGWRQITTSADMSSPDTAVFIAQATPWSPATSSELHATVIAVPRLENEKDFDAWKGKLSGKIILYGKPPKIELNPKPLLEHYDAEKLRQIFDYPLNLDFSEQHIDDFTPEKWADIFKHVNFREKVAKFFADEGAAAVLVLGWGGDGGIIKDDNGEMFGPHPFLPDHKQPIPSAVIANEAFGRISRLLEHNVPVTLDLNIHTEFTGDHEQGYNVIAEIPGADPALKSQVVMAGGHLDSWIAGTGATDDGAGVIITMEAIRILAALHVHPRRTIRAALWSDEEEDEFGSGNYVKQHFAALDLSTTPDQLQVPQYLREIVGPPTPKPEYSQISVYFNIDNGGGKLLGVYAENNSAAAGIFEQWIAPLRDIGVTTITLRPSGSSDQDSFNRVGIPAFQFIQDPRDYGTRTVHSNQDVYERLSPDDLKQAAVVEATFLYDAAMRDEMIPRQPMPFSEKPVDLKITGPDVQPAK